MKLFTKVVESCIFCPNIKSDINGTRWECASGFTVRFICWQSDEEKIEIPKWCPLPENKIDVPKKEVSQRCRDCDWLKNELCGHWADSYLYRFV